MACAKCDPEVGAVRWCICKHCGQRWVCVDITCNTWEPVDDDAVWANIQIGSPKPTIKVGDRLIFISVHFKDHPPPSRDS